MAADFDEPVFDDDFVKGATFTEPSARERLRPPSRRERRRIRRAARRAMRADRGRGFGLGLPRRRRYREPSHRRAVLQLIGIVIVLFAISYALWWWNSAPREPEPVRPVVPTLPEAPPPGPDPAPSTAAPEEIPEV